MLLIETYYESGRLVIAPAVWSISADESDEFLGRCLVAIEKNVSRFDVNVDLSRV